VKKLPGAPAQWRNAATSLIPMDSARSRKMCVPACRLLPSSGQACEDPLSAAETSDCCTLLLHHEQQSPVPSRNRALTCVEPTANSLVVRRAMRDLFAR
jgi:hypothetical protein